MKALRGTVSDVAKHKRIEATVIEVLGNRLIAQLSHNGKKLIGIPFIGGPVRANDIVYINYVSGQPVAECRGEQVDNVAAQPVRITSATARTEFPQSSIGGPEGTGELHDHYHQYISEALFTAEGVLTQGWHPHKIYNQTAIDKRILQVHLSIKSPGDDDIIVDIHKNGTTIFTNQANRPVLPAGDYAAFSEAIDDDAWQGGDYLEMAIDQVSTGTPGTDLTVLIVYELNSTTIDGPLIDLDEIADVTIASPVDQDVLIYDSGTGFWHNGTIGEAQPPHASTHENAGGDEIDVTGLSGVLADAQNADHIQGRDISSGAPSDGQGLVWSTSNNRWEPGSVSSGSTVAAHASTHQFGGSDVIKLDDLFTPDDNTDLNATTGAHGLLPKLGGGTTNFLRADGAWAAPPSGGSSGGDAADITYTPSVLSDWNSDADPGDVDNALDQLAERVDDLEAAGGTLNHDHSGDAGDGGTFDAANLTSGSATDGYVLTADGANGAAWEVIPVIKHQIIFTAEGTIAVVTGALRIYNQMGVTKTVSEVFLSAGTAPTGAAIIVDIHKNGVTIFTTQSNRPQIAAGANTGNTTTIEVSSWADGEYFTMDIDQVGSTVAGANLTVHIVYS